MMPSIIRFSVALLMAFAFAVPVAANEDAVERFTFTVPNAPESTVDDDRFTLTINRWSSDAEREEMLRIMKERGSANALDAFRETGAIGYLRWPGGLEYSVRYAQRVERPDRTADVVLVVERPLWVWWNAGVTPAAASEDDARFSVVQIRLDANGKGEGRIVNGPAIETDERLGVVVPDFATRPVLLTDVRREERG